MQQIRKAVNGEEYQWGLKLSDFIINSEPEVDINEELLNMRSKCLQCLAMGEVSAPGMNWYLTEDLVMRGLEVKPSSEAKVARIKSGDIV